METSIVAAEDHQQRSNSSTPVSKSSGSLVQIDSISIDLGIQMENNEAGKCQHFSVRGFVADMRKRDRKMCSPFALDDNNPSLEQQLPPLYVPKFRWWRCQNCLKEIGVASASEEIGVLSKCCISGLIPSSSCSQLHSDANMPTVPSDFRKASNLNIFSETNSDKNNSINVNGNEYHMTSSDCKDEKNVETEHQTVSGLGNDSRCEEDREILTHTYNVIKFNSHSIEDRQIDEPVNYKSKIHGLMDTSDPNGETHNDANIVPTIESFKFPGSNSTETCLAEKLDTPYDEQRNLSKASEALCLSCNMENAMNANSFLEVRPPSLELKGNDDESSESEKVTGSAHRRTRKVRLLTELLSGKENAGHDYKADTAALDAMPDISDGNDSLDEIALDGNTEKTFRSPQRKRKIPQAEDDKSLDKICINNLAKKIESVEGDRENTIPTIEISGSDQGGDTYATVGLQIGVKRQRAKDGIDRSMKLSKKKNKQSPVDNGISLLLPRKEASDGDLDKYCAAASCSKERYDTFTDGGMESHLKQAERKSSLWKKKNKMPQFEVGQSSLLPPTNSVPGDELAKRRDVEFMHFYPGTINQQADHDASTKMGLDLSLNSFMAAERNDRNIVDRIEDKIDSFPSQQKSIPYREFFVKDWSRVSDSSFLHKSTPNPSLRKALLCDIDERVAQRTNILHKKQNYSSLLKEGCSPMDKKSEYSGSFNHEKSIEVHGHSEVVKKHNDQGMPDDIPMEIVELMAKNQYERGLSEAQQNCCFTDKFYNKTSSQLISFPQVHGKGNMRLLDKEFLSMKKFQLDNARKGIMTASENGGAAKSHLSNFSHINRKHLGLGQLEENAAFTMYPFQKIQQKQAGRPQFSASSSIRHTTAQNYDWNGSKPPQRPSLTSMPTSEPYNAYHSGSQKSEASGHFCSSLAPNRMPFSFNISQSSPAHSNNTERHTQHTDMLHKGKIIRDFDLNSSNLNSSNGEMLIENFDYESFKRATAGYPFISKERRNEINPGSSGSVDPSSNETIPAMQLLSLMDARMPSNAPFSLDAKRFLEKPFSPCDYHPKVSTNGKMCFLEKPLFPNHHHSKGFSTPVPPVYTRSDPRPSSPLPVHRNKLSENLCKCSPMDAVVAPLATLPPINQVLRTGVMGELSFRSQAQDKGRETYSSVQNRGRKLQKSTPGGRSSISRQCNPCVDKQKGILVSSDPMNFPLQSNGLENSAKQIEHHSQNMQGTVSPKKRISRNPICCLLNQNPAELTIPHMGNVYTIGREMLLGKIPLRKRPTLANMDARRRQKILKTTPLKDHGNHRA